jgi:hypothetical protein
VGERESVKRKVVRVRVKRVKRVKRVRVKRVKKIGENIQS